MFRATFRPASCTEVNFKAALRLHATTRRNFLDNLKLHFSTIFSPLAPKKQQICQRSLKKRINTRCWKTIERKYLLLNEEVYSSTEVSNLASRGRRSFERSTTISCTSNFVSNVRRRTNLKYSRVQFQFHLRSFIASSTGSTLYFQDLHLYFAGLISPFWRPFCYVWFYFCIIELIKSLPRFQENCSV